MSMGSEEPPADQPARRGGSAAQSTSADLGPIPAAGKKGLALLGFKDVSLLKPYHTLKSGYFAVASDARQPGSEVALAALVEAMHAKGKMAIVGQGFPRPSQMAMLPQVEERDQDDVLLPVGVHLLPLAFGDDMRSLPLHPLTEEPAADEREAARALVKEMTIRYTRPPNPVLETFYAGLQAEALQEAADEVPDLTGPDQGVLATAKPTAEALKAAIYGDDEPLATTPQKRAGSSAGPASKRQRTTGGVPDSLEGWKALADKGDLAGLKVDDLRTFCREQDIAFQSRARKDRLVELVAAHLSSDSRDTQAAGTSARP